MSLPASLQYQLYNCNRGSAQPTSSPPSCTGAQQREHAIKMHKFGCSHPKMFSVPSAATGLREILFKLIDSALRLLHHEVTIIQNTNTNNEITSITSSKKKLVSRSAFLFRISLYRSYPRKQTGACLPNPGQELPEYSISLSAI